MQEDNITKEKHDLIEQASFMAACLRAVEVTAGYSTD